MASSAGNMGNSVSNVSTGMETNYENLCAGTENLGSAISNMASSVDTSVQQVNASYGTLNITMGTVQESSKNMATNYRSLMGQSASLIMNSVQLGDVMDRLAKGQIDAGRAALMLGMNFLQLGSNIYVLYGRYGEKIAAQALSIAGDVREAASNIGSAITRNVTAFADLIIKYTAKIALQIYSIAGDAADAAGNFASAAAKGVHAAASWALTVAEHARAIAHAVANAVASLGVAVPIMIAAAAAAAVGIGAYLISSKQYGGLVEETQPYLLHKGEYVETAEERQILTKIAEFPEGKSSTVTNYITIENPTFRSRGDMDYLVDRLKRMGKA